MKPIIAAQLWERLRKEARAFPWKDALPRMAADFLMVNAAMVAAFVLWFFFYAVIVQVPQPEALATNFKNFVHTYWLFWSLLALLIFHLSGFYTRTRGYASRYKAWVIFRAISLFIVLFVFADYFLLRGALVPRGVALLGWALTVGAVGGSRLAKDLVLRLYRVEPRRRSRPVNRVLVVGGAGYLGSVLVPLLLERGYKTRVFDSFLFGDKALEAFKSHPDCELAPGDIRDIQAVVQAMRDCDAVIHLAAIVGDPACDQNETLAIEVNRAAVRMLVEVARGSGVSRFLFASTCSVYGASDFLMDERTRVDPISTYAKTKADSEQILVGARTPDFHPTVLRLGTLFGLSPRIRFDLVVNLLVAKAATTGRITIFNGDQWRPFVHVQDAARAFVVCLEANPEVVSGEIFNAGAFAMNCRLLDVGETIARLLPKTEIEHVQNADKRNYRVAFDKIHTRLGFACERTLEDGVQEIYALLRSGRIDDFRKDDFNNQAMTSIFARTAEAERSSLQLLETLARYER